MFTVVHDCPPLVRSVLPVNGREPRRVRFSDCVVSVKTTSQSRSRELLAYPRVHEVHEIALGRAPGTVDGMDQNDVAHLRRCIELARQARADGNEPFGSLLVGADGTVLTELMNTVGTGDMTGHPELALATWASMNLTVDERAAATLYTSCESCAMCAGGQYWAAIGRLVFALSGEQLADIVPPGGGRSLRLSSREVFARGDSPVDVEGPCDELAADALAVFDGFFARP